MDNKDLSPRIASVKRKTRETDIELSLDLDGAGIFQGSSGQGFFDHMLELLAKHSGWNLNLHAVGDLQVDAHHTIEDIGITLGQALVQAIGSGQGIARYACWQLPMDETLAEVALDWSGRGYLVYKVPGLMPTVGTFDTQLCQEFFQALTRTAGITLHINIRYGSNTHHILEAIFKAFARALKIALTDTGSGDIPSSKGALYT